MVEFLRPFDTILTILLGWLLGLLTPSIAERLRRLYKRRDLVRAVVPYKQSLFDKTFNNPSPTDRLIANQEQGYRDAGLRAEIVMQAIGNLQKRYGSAK
jgi:hypothetical protein